MRYIRERKESSHDGESFIFIGKTTDGDVLWLSNPVYCNDISLDLYTFSAPYSPSKSKSIKYYGDLKELDLSILDEVGTKQIDVFKKYMESIQFFMNNHADSSNRNKIVKDLSILIANCLT